MGLGPNWSCGTSYSNPPPNPDPSNFKIIAAGVMKNYVIVNVHYPDCTNYEGNKILVYKGVSTVEELLKKTYGKLDPHFHQTNFSPIARFAPTEEGAEQAAYFVAVMAKKDEQK